MAMWDGEISGRNGGRSLSGSGDERFDAGDGVLLIVKTESAQQTVDFDIRFARPNADVVTVLVGDAGTLNVEFHVNAVSFCVDVEELASDGDRSWEGVLGIVGTLRSRQSTGGEFTCNVSVSI